MATTFIRVRDPEQAAELEMAGLLWCKYPTGACVHIAPPRLLSRLKRGSYLRYWKASGVLWSEHCNQFGYMAEE